MNQYDEIAQYYDLIMESGYYDYGQESQSLHSILKGQKKVLEIGIGTGLLVEKLLNLDPNYEITGIDFTGAMLDRSQARLENRAKLIEANVLSMNLQKDFQAIYSHGVPAGISVVGKDYHFYSFLPNFEDTVEMINNIARHLVTGGLLILNIQGEETDADGEQEISNGIVYSQQKYLEFLENQEMYFWEKEYIFQKEGAILAKDRHRFLILYGQLLENTMKKVGFKLQGPTSDNLYFIYQKVI